MREKESRGKGPGDRGQSLLVKPLSLSLSLFFPCAVGSCAPNSSRVSDREWGRSGHLAKGRARQ